MDDRLAGDPCYEQQQPQEQQQALQAEALAATQQQHSLQPTQQHTNMIQPCDTSTPSAAAAGEETEPCDPAAAAAASSTAAAVCAPATEVLISCQGLEALLFLDPAFPRGLAKPIWLVRCLCPACQQEAGPDG
jgi:hypothetical protein